MVKSGRVAVGAPTIGREIVCCGGGRRKGKPESVAEADLVDADGAALHVGGVVDALHGVKGVAREAAKATILLGELGNVGEADVFNATAAAFHVGWLGRVSVGSPKIRGYVSLLSRGERVGGAEARR